MKKVLISRRFVHRNTHLVDICPDTLTTLGVMAAPGVMHLSSLEIHKCILGLQEVSSYKDIITEK